MIDRRNLLKSTVAAAAVLGGGLTGNVFDASRVTSTTLAGGLAGEAPKYPFKWWVSLDGGEVYNEHFDTKAEAIKVALEHGGGLVAECQQQDYDLRVDGQSFLEMLYGQNTDLMGEDAEFIEPTQEQVSELEDELNKVVAAWVRRNKIDTAAWQFGEVRNKELIPSQHLICQDDDDDPLYLAQEG